MSAPRFTSFLTFCLKCVLCILRLAATSSSVVRGGVSKSQKRRQVGEDERPRGLSNLAYYTCASRIRGSFTSLGSSSIRAGLSKRLRICADLTQKCDVK